MNTFFFCLLFSVSYLVLHIGGQVSNCPGTVPNPITELEQAWRFDTTDANNSVLFGIFMFPQSSLAQAGGPSYYNGNLYISDWENLHVIVFNPQSPGADPANYTGGTIAGGPLGMRFDTTSPTPKFYWAEREGKQVTVHTLNNHAGKQVLTDNYDGDNYNAVRDLALRADGSIYFIDQQVQLVGPLDPALYRILPTGEVELLSTNFGSPGGLAFSPDQRILYVSDSNNNLIRKFNVNKDGSVNDAGVFAQSVNIADPVIPDMAGPSGIITDSRGNVYVSGQHGELIITPAGTHIYSSNTDRPAKDQRTGLTTAFGPGVFGAEQNVYYTANFLYVNRIRGCIPPNPTTGVSTGNCWGPLLSTDGGCCIGTECSIVSGAGQCPGGNWLGEGTRCTPGRCAATRGACCYNDGHCTIVGSSLYCNGGSFLGEGKTCEHCSGGCCNGASCTVVFNGQCAGDYLGTATSCTASACDKGACCDSESTACYQAAATLCEPDIFAGANTLCNQTDICLGASGTAPGTKGACCLGNACLIALNEAVCTDATGVFLGASSTCDLDTCIGPIDGSTQTGSGPTGTGADGGDGGTDGGTSDGGDGTVDGNDSSASRLSFF